jgi:hypothetical protein
LAPQRGGHVAFFNSGFGDNTPSVHTQSKEHTIDVSKPPNFLLCSIESPQKNNFNLKQEKEQRLAFH